MSFIEPFKELSLDHSPPRLIDARVVAVDAAGVEVEMDGGRAAARMAVAGVYRPAEGDLVVVMAQGERRYVIGVLEGKGRTVLEVPGDLDLSAPRGTISLAGRGVRISAPTVEVAAGSLRLAARAVAEEFGNAWRWVRERFDLKAGDMRTDVEQTYRLRAQDILERADDRVAIDGQRINLG